MITREQINSFSDSPGVYIFRDNNNFPLYIGKSIKLRSRLKSHYRDAATIAKETTMIQQSHSVEVIYTAGELGALLRESFLVKTLSPVLNRQLRRRKMMSVVVLSKAENGVLTLSLQMLPDDIEINPTQHLATFSTVMAGKAFLEEFCATHMLCPRFCGLEKHLRACFRYQLGKCHGVCAGKEDISLYNERLIQALEPIRFKNWPFEGCVTFTELCPGMRETFTILDWKVQQSNKSLGIEGYNLWTKQSSFDHDQYRILKRELLKEEYLEQMI